MNKYLFYFSGKKIEYKIIYKNVKNINLRINKNNEITVSSSPRVPVEQIKSFVESKGEWIVNHMSLRNDLKLSQPDKGIYSGKKVFFLGNEYTLNIVNSEINKVEIQNELITIYTKYIRDEPKIQKQYLNWLKQNSKTVFKNILDDVYTLVQPYGIEYPEFNIRNMKSIWGSCSVNRQKICLNLQLIKAHEKCIEHVILHELVHFKYPNHGKDFYKLLGCIMPEWKTYKNDLETNYKDGQ